MTDSDQQLDQFHAVVERKRKEAEAASHARPDRSGPAPDDAPEPATPDEIGGKGEMTADKWNQ